MADQLGRQQMGGFGVALLSGFLVEQEQILALVNLVQIIFLQPVGPDRAVLADEAVHMPLHIIEIIRLTQLKPGPGHRQLQHPRNISPAFQQVSMLPCSLHSPSKASAILRDQLMVFTSVADIIHSSCHLFCIY